MRSKAYILFILITLAGSHAFCNKKDYPSYPHSNARIIKHNHFTIQFNTKTRVADWTYHQLSKEDLVFFRKRPAKYLSDPKLPQSSPKYNDYTGSGYDRGHLVPSGDMTRSEKAQQETFFLTNIAPQHPSLNRYTWLHLERLIRDWAESGKHLKIYTGPIFPKNSSQMIKESEIWIPSSFYKIIAETHCTPPKVIAFKFSNKKYPEDLKEAITTIDEIEKLTSIDFFTQFPPAEQHLFESQTIISDWFPNHNMELLFTLLLISAIVYLKIKKHRQTHR